MLEEEIKALKTCIYGYKTILLHSKKKEFQLYSVVFNPLRASKRQKSTYQKMDNLQNEQDFSRIVREHKSTIYTVCYMFSKNEDEVNDLFQEVLINLWKGLQNFRGESDVRTWIYRISLNTCISCDRKKRKRKTIPLTMNINPFTDSDDDSRQVQQLNRRISQLGPFDRAIILLWLENMSYEEIGEIVGISTKNVSVRLFRIKEKLKKTSETTKE